MYKFTARCIKASPTLLKWVQAHLMPLSMRRRATYELVDNFVSDAQSIKETLYHMLLLIWMQLVYL